MGSMDRSKKRVHLWKKAVVQFLLCFVMGFFTGFAPTGKSSFPGAIKSEISPAKAPAFEPTQVGPQETSENAEGEDGVPRNQVLPAKTGPQKHMHISWKQVIVITPTKDKDPLREVLLRRMADTLKLVSPPLLWIVTESCVETSNVSEILRRTGVMYRHLVFNENFTDSTAETDYQRNLALNHIEHHRLSGIVHFAGLSNVYDLSFFEEIRAIEAFGAWPLAKLSEKRKTALIEGPVCESSQVVGWHMKAAKVKEKADEDANNFIHISSFGFNSSILWDPERWGRLFSTDHGPTQNSLKFVKQGVIEDETNLKGIPSRDCSKVNLWQLHLSAKNIAIKSGGTIFGWS